MRFSIQTISIKFALNEIKDKNYDLQPDYQRGVVWSEKKKIKLIDTILRKWTIPTIYLVQNDQGTFEVLDGQQRLAAIEGFYDGKFAIDGSLEPFDESIQKYHGFKYSDLPEKVQNDILNYSLNIIILDDFKPSEPAELFNRLNQPMTLTSSEKRNAYIGAARNQVKDLSKIFIQHGADRSLLGFDNARLAYDESIAKLCYILELGTLSKKITTNDIARKYRSGEPFTEECIERVNATLIKFLTCVKQAKANGGQFRFNKATLLTWLIFICKNLNYDDSKISALMSTLEFLRQGVKTAGSEALKSSEFIHVSYNIPFFEVMLITFNQRTSMGNTDASSVIYRDIIIHLLYDALFQPDDKLLRTAILYFEHGNFNNVLDGIRYDYNWGEKL